jgi:uncharacterized protein
MRTLPFHIKQQDLAAFARKWGVREVALFGSVLREDFGAGSDVDVLVTFAGEGKLTLESYVGMREELSAMFGGREIDLVEKSRLGDPYRRHEILRTQEAIYAG